MEITEYQLPCAVAEGEEVFAIGDVHGCGDALRGLLAIAAGEDRLAPTRTLLTLGDLIDRGADSLGAIEAARDGVGLARADRAVHLAGNHELMARTALDPSATSSTSMLAQNTWMRNGGAKVVAQVMAADADADPERDVGDALRATLWAWLDGLASHHHCGAATFVHAGLPPRGVDLAAALSADWRLLRGMDEDAHWAWVRDPFLRREAGPHHGRFVVHGHTTPHNEATRDRGEQVRRWRLNLDGGSYATGRVRMARLVGDHATVWEV